MWSKLFLSLLCLCSLSFLSAQTTLISTSPNYYVPQVNAGDSLNVALGASGTFSTSYSVNNLGAGVSSTISAANPIAVHLTMAYPTWGDSLTVNITHNGVSVRLLAISHPTSTDPTLADPTTTCAGVGFQGRGAQVVFTDAATIPRTSLGCTAPNKAIFQSGESFIVQPADALAAFNGMSVSGPWTITVQYSVPAYVQAALANTATSVATRTTLLNQITDAAASRYFIGWGLTVGPRQCGVNQYLPPPSLVAGNCVACPVNSLPITSTGVHGIHSCPCLFGYDTSKAYQCTACPAGTFFGPGQSNALPFYFRNPTTLASANDLASQTQLFFVHQQGTSTCFPCHSNTRYAAGGSAAACGPRCASGYTKTVGVTPVVGECVACPSGTYKSDIGSQACTTCGNPADNAASYATLLPATNGTSDCVCAIGFESESNKGILSEGTKGSFVQCAACPAGTFKSAPGLGSCQQCGPYAKPNADQSACVCDSTITGYPLYDYAQTLNGAGCVAQRVLTAVPSNVCSVSCGGGITVDQIVCQDALGVRFNETACFTYQFGFPTPMTRPNATRPCNTQPCVKNGFTPQFSSGDVNANIPFASQISSTIEVPASVNGQVSETNSLAVQIDLSWSSFHLEQLTITLTHQTTTDSAFAVVFQPGAADSVCSKSYIATGSPSNQGPSSELIFSDEAPMEEPMYCADDSVPAVLDASYLQFQSGEAYVLLPLDSLDATFGDMDKAGLWTLTLTVAGDSNDQPNAVDQASRMLYSWGLTFDPVNCPPNQYIPSPFLMGDASVVCTDCPINDYITDPSLDPAGNYLSDINSCPCQTGYDSSVAGDCTICPAGSVRAFSDFVSPIFQQQQGVASCVACHGARSSAQSCDSTQCDAGYFGDAANPTAPCTICPANTYSAANAMSCTSCPLSQGLYQMTSAPGSTAASACLCPAGTFFNTGSSQCEPCPANTYSPQPGAVGSCSACAAGASSPAPAANQPGATRCTCNAGVFDYTTAQNPSGVGCVSLQRFFANGTFSACSQPCGGGIRTRVVNCTDATNALFAPAACMGPNVQMPPTSEVCNTQSCAAFAYQPEYPSTLVNLNIPTSLESDIGGKNIPRSAVNSTIVIPVRANNGTYGDARNKDGLAVHFTGSYPDFLFGLNLAIVHEGVVVPLLRIPYNCFTSSIQKFAQITVADNSGLPNVYCQEQAGTTTLAEYPVFQSDQAYVIPSVTPLSAFNGLPVAGTYTLYAWTEFNALTANTDTTDRTFVQWGITTNPTNCPPNQFTPTDRLLNSGVCQPCSQNSYPVAGGVNSPNSCPCYPGYDASVPGQCTACPFGTYRSLTATVSPVFQQRQGVAGCVDCHASTSASPATSPNDCMTDCARGYVPITTTANGISTTRCTECPAGTQKTSNQPTGSLIGAGTCTACPANTYTSKPGSLLCLPCAANATSVAGSPACSCKVGFTDYTGTSTDGSACQPTRRFVAGDFSTCLSLNPWQPTLASPCENGRRVRTVTCQDMFGQVYPESMCPLGTKQSTETPCNTDVSCLPNGYLPQFASGYLGQPIPYNNMTAAANAPFKSVLNVPANMAGVDPLISNNNRVIVHFTAFYPSLIHTLQVSLCKTIGSTERCVQLLNLGSTVCLGSYGSEGAAASTIFSDQASIPALFCTNANLVTFKGGESYVVPPAQALATFNGLPTDGTWTLRVACIPNQYFVAPDVLAARKLISWGLTFKPKSCSPGTFTPQPYFNTGACMNCPNPATTNKINTFPAAQINTVNSCPCKGGYYIDTSSVMSGQAPTCKVCPAGQYRMISPFMPPYFQQTQTSTGCQPCHSGTPRFPQPTEYAVQCDNQCEPGYYFNPAFGCLPCSYGAYKGTVGPQACQSCALTFAPRSTTLNKNATSINECICGPGYQGVRDTTTGATRCTPCLAGSYKETAGNGLCSLCSIAGTNAPGSAKCQCLFGFDIPKDFVGQPPANGSACSPIRFFSPSSWSACNATCETGTQTRSLVCTDISGAIFSDDACAGKTMPSTIRTCVAQSSCTKNGYVPQFSTGPVDYQFTGSVDVPLTIEGSGVTIGTNNNGADLSLGQLSFAVLVSLFTDAATTVTVRLTRVSSGVSQTFAVPTVSARFGYHNPSQPLLGDSATQLVYADASNWDGPRGHTVLPGINEQFAAGETYILRAVVGTTSLAARFDGVPLDGDWLLTVTAAAGTLRSWGITANPTVCPLSLQKSFVPAPSLTSACLPCPAKSTFIPTVTASAGQTNSINSCPCNAGYDAMTPYTCTACPTGTARPAGRTAADDGTTNAINAQQLGASFCTACNSANPAGSANCLSDITNPAGSFCAQGYEGPAASGLPCVPCTTYKYKNATDASACVNCPQTGFDQSANPLANGQGVRTYGAQPATQFIQCDCDGGFYNDSSVSTRGGCKQCPVGTYRPAVPTRQITGCLPCAALISAAVEFPAYRCNCTRIGNIQYIDPMSTIDGSGCQPTVKLVYVPAGTTASFTTSSEDITDALFAGIPCNAPCDGGKKNIVPKCVDQDSNEQDLALCFNQGYTLSGPLSRDCNTVSCLYSVALGRQFAQPFTGYTPQYSKVYLPSTFYGGNGNPFVAPQKTNNGAGSMFDANTAPTAPFSNGRGYPIADPNNEFSLTDRACTQIGQSDQCGLPIKLVAQAGTTSAGGYATVSSPTTSVLTVPPQPKGQDIIGPQNPISVLTTLIYGSVDTAPLGSVGTLRMELEHYNTRVTLFALPQAAGCQGSVGSVMTNDQSPSPHVVYPAQLVFSDNAALNFPTCSPDDQPFFMGGEAYILRAASPLSAFYGLPVQGDYTLRLSSIPFAADQRLTGTPARELQATERYLASWGLVFNATTCGPNSFSAIIDNGAGSAYNPTSSLVGGTFAIEDTAGQLLAVPSANTAQCMECGTDSQLVNRTSVTAQMSSVMSCACRPGFDYATLQVSSGPACSPCAAGSYKNSSSPYGIQAMQNSCTKCPPTAGTDTVTGATLFSQACTGTCPANQFFSQNTHGGECLPCPIGTTRSIVQPVCVQCSGGMTTQAPGSGTCGCPSGHYEEGGICKPCVGGYTSATAFGLVGDTMCTPCPLGYNSTYPYVSCMLCSTDALGRQLQPIWDGSNVDPHPGFFCGLGAYWTAPAFPAAGTPCPSTCDGGIFTRTVTCMNNGVPDPTGAACANLPKPATTQFCPVGQSSVSCIGNGYLTDYQTGLLTAGTARIPFADEAAASPTRLNLDLQIPNTGAIISAANQLAVAVTVQFPSQLSSLKLSLTRLDGNGNPTIVVPLFEVPVCSGQIIDSTDPSVSIQGAQIVFADQASQPGLCSTGNQGANLYARNAYFMNPTFPLSAFYGQPLGGTWRLSAWSTDQVGATPAALRNIVSWGISLAATKCLPNQYVALPALNKGCTLCPANSMSAPAGVNGINNCACMPGYDAVTAGSCTQCDVAQYRSASPISTLPSGAAYIPTVYQTPQEVSMCQSCNGLVNNTVTGSGDASNCGSQCFAGYTPLAGQACRACEQGKYQPVDRQAAPCLKCTDVLAHSTTASTGATASTACVCQAGYVLDGSGVCQPCAANTYTTAPGASSCTLCANTADTNVPTTTNGQTGARGTPNSDWACHIDLSA